DYRWIDVDGDGHTDLVVGGSWEDRFGPGAPPEAADLCFGRYCSGHDCFKPCNDSSGLGGPVSTAFVRWDDDSQYRLEPARRCTNGYIWQVYKNLHEDSPWFDLGTPETWCVPVSLGLDQHPAPLDLNGRSVISPSAHLFAYIDMNADGIPDIVSAAFHATS